MKTRLLPSLGLFVILLAACAPAVATTEPSVQQPVVPVAVEPTATPAPSEPDSPDVAVAPTEAVAPEPLPVATSRGSGLHATDPRTVSLATGGLQFVEFFRFT